jgi:hypothetical protein
MTNLACQCLAEVRSKRAWEDREGFLQQKGCIPGRGELKIARAVP